MDAFLQLQNIPLALVFAVAGVSKLRNPASTASILRAFKLVPVRFAATSAWALAFGELLAAAAIAALPPQLGGALALVVLSGMTTVLTTQLVKGNHMDCGCLGGGLPAVISWWTVARNVFLSLPAFLLLSAPSGSLPPSATAVPALMIVSLETCALFLVAAALSMQSVISVRSAVSGAATS